MDYMVSLIAIVGLMYTLSEIKKYYCLFSINKELARIYIYLFLFWLTLFLGEVLSFKLLHIMSVIFLILHISLRSRSAKNKVTELKKMLVSSTANLSKDSSLLSTETEKDSINIREAIENDDIYKVAYLLDNGFDIEEYDDGYTPLMKALEKKKVKVAQYLIESGANIHAKEPDTREQWAMSPVVLSSFHGLHDLTEYFLQNNTDAEYLWTDSGNLVDIVKEGGDQEMVTLLNKYGVKSLIEQDVNS